MLTEPGFDLLHVPPLEGRLPTRFRIDAFAANLSTSCTCRLGPVTLELSRSAHDTGQRLHGVVGLAGSGRVRLARFGIHELPKLAIVRSVYRGSEGRRPRRGDVTLKCARPDVGGRTWWGPST